MTMKRPWLILLVCSVLFGQAARADDEDDSGPDRNYQLYATANGALSKRSGWSVGQYLYFDRNHKLYAYLPQATLTWSAAKWLSLSTGYQLSRLEQGDSIWFRHQLNTAATFRLASDDWRLSYRLRWQGTLRDPGEGGTRYRSFMRNQVQLRYSGVDRVEPYLTVEFFHRLDASRTSSGLDRTRYTLGGELGITQRQSLTLWIRQQVYTNNDPDLDSLGLGYSYSFK
jgi:hypothetical protein